MLVVLPSIHRVRYIYCVYVSSIFNSLSPFVSSFFPILYLCFFFLSYPFPLFVLPSFPLFVLPSFPLFVPSFPLLVPSFQFFPHNLQETKFCKNEEGEKVVIGEGRSESQKLNVECNNSFWHSNKKVSFVQVICTSLNANTYGTKEGKAWLTITVFC